MAEEAGRDPIPVTLSGASPDRELIERGAEAGVHRCTFYISPRTPPRPSSSSTSWPPISGSNSQKSALQDGLAKLERHGEAKAAASKQALCRPRTTLMPKATSSASGSR